MSTVIPKRALPDLSRIDPSIYPGLPDRMPPHQQARFLDMLCNGASQLHACQVIGIPLLLVWRERHANPEFDSFLEYVIEHARPHAIEELAIQFATRGVAHETVKRVTSPVLIDGAPISDLVGDQLTIVEETVTTGHEFGAHTLLMNILKGQMREKYGTERREDSVTVSPGAPPAVRTSKDALALLGRMREELKPVIEGSFTEVKDDGSDLV